MSDDNFYRLQNVELRREIAELRESLQQARAALADVKIYFWGTEDRLALEEGDVQEAVEAVLAKQRLESQ